MILVVITNFASGLNGNGNNGRKPKICRNISADNQTVKNAMAEYLSSDDDDEVEEENVLEEEEGHIFLRRELSMLL